MYFYPRSPCGERPKTNQGGTHHENFYPRSPCGERQTVVNNIVFVSGFLSTLSLRRATLANKTPFEKFEDFYPRSPCGERQRAENHANSQQKFLSTLSLRRATGSNQTIISKTNHFYPRSPCGERRESRQPCAHPTRDFYPRSPCGERPRQDLINGIRLIISIHALLAESDPRIATIRRQTANFYPRSPCGERRKMQKKNETAKKFLSTLSLRRATLFDSFDVQPLPISIHALLAESDFITRQATPSTSYFYPRSPCGERPDVVSVQHGRQNFYPRSPCGERHYFCGPAL